MNTTYILVKDNVVSISPIRLQRNLWTIDTYTSVVYFLLVVSLR